MEYSDTSTYDSVLVLRFSVEAQRSVVDQESRDSLDKFILVLPSCLSFAASAGSLYRNMLVRPRSRMQPEDIITINISINTLIIYRSRSYM